jgi:hypothetical protein
MDMMLLFKGKGMNVVSEWLRHPPHMRNQFSVVYSGDVRMTDYYVRKNTIFMLTSNDRLKSGIDSSNFRTRIRIRFRLRIRIRIYKVMWFEHRFAHRIKRDGERARVPLTASVVGDDVNDSHYFSGLDGCIHKNGRG